MMLRLLTVLLLFNAAFCEDVCNCKAGLTCNPETRKCQAQLDDLILTEDQFSLFSGTGSKAGSAFNTLWSDDTPNDGCVTIPFYFSEEVYNSEALKLSIRKVLGFYNAFSCLKFRPARNGDVNMLRFIVASGCNSFVGMIGGRQDISSCSSLGTIQHEVMHAVGFYHEQSRPDRDDHVEVLFDNIQTGKESNFAKFSPSQIDSFGTPYDILSIMQYRSYTFSKNGDPTIVEANTGNVLTTQRWILSNYDQQQILAMYSCNGKRGIPKTSDCHYSLDLGVSYNGTKNTTASGRTCQRWDAHSPHAHNLDPSIITGGDLIENYCRNPNFDSRGPWCLTTDPGVLLEPCGIPTCTPDVPMVEEAPPPVNTPGFWTEFNTWSSCSGTCAPAYQYRTRHCIGNEPGSAECPGEFWEARPCEDVTLEPCPTDPVGSWDGWSEFSACSKPCGNGVKTRVRFCDSKYCGPEVFVQEACSNTPCPRYPDKDCFDPNDLDSYRGTVSVSESGVRCRRWSKTTTMPSDYPTKGLRGRKCRNPTNQTKPFCHIKTAETAPCNVSICNNVSVWSTWSSFSACSAPCGGGRKYKVRDCVGGFIKDYMCQGKAVSSRKCNKQACPPSPTASPSPPITIPFVPSPPLPEIGCTEVGASESLLYRGNASTTDSGVECQRWDSMTPWAHTFTDLETIVVAGLTDNYCRNPDGDVWPWCYGLDYSQGKQYCNIPYCMPDPPIPQPPVGCVQSGDIDAYRGGKDVAHTGASCIRWDLLESNFLREFQPKFWPGRGLGAHNYCRSVGHTFLWCPTSQNNYASCNVPSCW